MSRCLVAFLMLVLLAAPLSAQPATPPAPAPGQAPAPAGGEVRERNTAFDHVVAFTGVVIVLVVVCYPSRRY